MKNLYSKILTGVFVAGSFVSVQAQKADAKSRQILDAVAQNYKSKKNSYFKFYYGTGNNGKVSKPKPEFSTPLHHSTN